LSDFIDNKSPSNRNALRGGQEKGKRKGRRKKGTDNISRKQGIGKDKTTKEKSRIQLRFGSSY